MKGPLVEDCYYITPAYDVDFDRRREMGIHVEYHIEAEDYILVTVGNNEPQRIETEAIELSFASRKLRYTLTAINKKTSHGKMLYAMNRMDKLSKQREKMGTILYNGKYTRKFQSFLRQCDRAGYTNAVEDAARLMTALKEFQRI